MFADRFRNVLQSLARTAREPAMRRKLRRGAILAAIAAFGLGSFDFLLTGGPAFNPIGADAPRFELVASAQAAETRVAVAAAPMLAEAAAAPTPIRFEPLMDAYDPLVSADDLLGAPVDEGPLEAELAALLEQSPAGADKPTGFSIEPLPSFVWR